MLVSTRIFSRPVIASVRHRPQTHASHSSELSGERATIAQLRIDLSTAIEKECVVADALMVQTARAERAESDSAAKAETIVSLEAQLSVANETIAQSRADAELAIAAANAQVSRLSVKEREKEERASMDTSNFYQIQTNKKWVEYFRDMVSTLCALKSKRIGNPRCSRRRIILWTRH